MMAICSEPSGAMSVVKAASLSGQPGLQFWRNSVTGALEVRPRAGGDVTLNDALHAND